MSSITSTFRGPARQYGSGGLGAFAMRMGRVAVPLVKKYFVPVGKEFGRNLVSAFVPEIPKIVAGRKQPRKALKESLKKSVEKTVKHLLFDPPHPLHARTTAAAGGSAQPGGQAAAQIRCNRIEKERKATILPFRTKTLPRKVAPTFCLLLHSLKPRKYQCHPHRHKCLRKNVQWSMF